MVHGAGGNQAAWLRCLKAHIDRLQEEAEWLPELEKDGVVLGWGRG